MRLLSGVYTITLYKDGRFCWLVERKEKKTEDYKSDAKWAVFTCVFIAFVGVIDIINT
jgi:hypothetical protein